MKTLFITTSRKKRPSWSNSAYIAWMVRLWCRGEKSVMHMGGKKDYEKIKAACAESDNVVFVMPVYVDGIPANVMEFLADAETEAGSWSCNVYVVTNCGFYEGSQCGILMQQLACWCEAAGLRYGGGFGSGAGEMLGTLRFTNIAGAPVLAAVIAAAVGFASGSVHSAVVSGVISVIVSIALCLLWTSGAFIKAAGFAGVVSRGEACRDRFTTVWFCGRPLFEFFANIFWLVRAAAKGVPPWRMK